MKTVPKSIGSCYAHKHMGKNRATLYLLVGYPGSGKTTTSQVIHDRTGAVHIWADYERRAMFGEPTHSITESHKLYDHLNKSTEILLADNQSVIFDTNFNFRKDRDRLRQLAEKYDASNVLIWIKLSKPLARKRAMSSIHAADNNYRDPMTTTEFNRITNHLEAPGTDENPTILDGTLLSPDYISAQLKLPAHRQVKTPRKP